MSNLVLRFQVAQSDKRWRQSKEEREESEKGETKLKFEA